MRPEIRCADHGEPVRLVPEDVVIVHEDGRYCGSATFTADPMGRDYAMALMLTERGLQMMRGGT